MPVPIDNPALVNRADSSATRRLFFALWPDATVRDAIAAMARDVIGRAGGRAPRPENHHLTLAFVGDVAVNRVDVLKRIGASAARTVAPLTLALDRLGEFRHTGIAWLGTDILPPDLEELVHRLREGLAAEAFPVEQRPFRAHVTLARRCGALTAATVAPVAWRVERITLTASETRPAGARYRELAGWSLG